MNWAIPAAPAGETARGLKPDSASSWAASSAPETLQRAAVAGGRARSRSAGVPEVPGLPRIALEEPEPAGVRGEPAVGGRGAEVELGRAAVQRGPGRRDPPRV